VTLLTAANDAQRELSLAVTATLVADGQETQNLLYRLAKKEAAELLRRTDYDFQLLTRTKSFTASLAALQSSGKATDFQRAVENTFWNTTTHRQIAGPLNSVEWARANSQSVTASIQQYAMFRYNGLYIFPTPTAADTITYDYIINTPVLDVDGVTYQTTFDADTDSYLLGDEILTLALVWRYLQTKGRDYAEALKDYEMALAATALAQRGAARTLTIAPGDGDPFIQEPNLPAVFG